VDQAGNVRGCDLYARVHRAFFWVDQAQKAENKKASERGLTGNTYVLPLFSALVKRKNEKNQRAGLTGNTYVLPLFCFRVKRHRIVTFLGCIVRFVR